LASRSWRDSESISLITQPAYPKSKYLSILRCFDACLNDAPFDSP
jgi:hypothetical protein